MNSKAPMIPEIEYRGLQAALRRLTEAGSDLQAAALHAGIDSAEHIGMAIDFACMARSRTQAALDRIEERNRKPQ